MDITGEREREQAAPPQQTAQAPEPRQLTRDELDRAAISYRRGPSLSDVLQFTPEQARYIEHADDIIQAGLRELDEMSTDKMRLGVPENIEQIALLNALFNIMVDKGVCTMAEVFIAKREAIAEQVVTCVEGAKRALAQQRANGSRVIVAGAHQMPDAD